MLIKIEEGSLFFRPILAAVIIAKVGLFLLPTY